MTVGVTHAGTFIIGGTDEIQTILDDQIVKIQAMNASPFVKPFKDRAATWEQTLQTLQVNNNNRAGVVAESCCEIGRLGEGQWLKVYSAAIWELTLQTLQVRRARFG